MGVGSLGYEQEKSGVGSTEEESTEETTEIKAISRAET